MADTFGLLPLPAPAATPGSAVSDPCLDVLLSFFAAVLNAELAAAWSSVHPRSEQNALGPAVAFTFGHSPQREFIDRKLPALFLFRSGGGAYEDWTADIHRAEEQLTLHWVFPPAKQEQQALRDPIVNGLSKALARAIRDGRHPAWVVASDLADEDAIRLAEPTTTLARVLEAADFNGSIGAGPVYAPRPFAITTAPAPGAYNTAEPFVVTGLLEGGVEHTESILLDKVDGGETMAGIWPFERVLRIEDPGQVLGTGRIAFGFAASPEAERGSIVERHAGLSELRLLGPGKARVLAIPMKDGPARPYEMVELELRVVEFLRRDLDADFGRFADAPDRGSGLFSEIRDEDGSVLETLLE